MVTVDPARCARLGRMDTCSPGAVIDAVAAKGLRGLQVGAAPGAAGLVAERKWRLIVFGRYPKRSNGARTLPPAL